MILRRILLVANTTQDSEEGSTVKYYNDGSMDNQTFNDSMNKNG